MVFFVACLQNALDQLCASLSRHFAVQMDESRIWRGYNEYAIRCVCLSVCLCVSICVSSAIACTCIHLCIAATRDYHANCCNGLLYMPATAFTLSSLCIQHLCVLC